MLANARPIDDGPEPITFKQVIDDEVARRARGRDAKALPDRTVKKYRDAADAFAKFRKSDNARTVTAAEGKAWIDAMQDAGDIGNRTVKNAAPRAWTDDTPASRATSSTSSPGRAKPTPPTESP